MSTQHAPSHDLRAPRGRRGASASIVALVGLALSALAAAEAISLASHHRSLGISARSVIDYAQRTHLGNPAVLITALVAMFLGLALLILACLPAPRRGVELHSPQPEISIAITTRGLSRALAAAAGSVDGISASHARIRTRRARISADTALRDTTGLQERVQAAVTAALTQLAPRRSLRPRTTLHRKDR